MHAVLPAAAMLVLALAPASDPEPTSPPAAESSEADPASAEAEVPEESDDPAELIQRAEQAFAEGRFEDVVALAARAYALTGDPAHLYAQALAERRLGHCREALVLYARLLVRIEEDARYSVLVEDTHQGIKLCEEELAAAEPKPEAPPEPEPEAKPSPPSEPPVAEPDDEPPPRRWFRDPWGGVMLGLGVGIAAGGGSALWVLSGREQRAATRVTDETLYAEAITRAQGLRTGAIVSLAVGGALVTGAVIRYVLVDRALRRGEPAASVGPTQAILGWRRSF